MRQQPFAPGVDMAWADDYAEACFERDDALDALGRLRRALADRIGHHWRLLHECRRQHDLAPTPPERASYQREIVLHRYVLRELLAVRRAGRGRRE